MSEIADAVAGTVGDLFGAPTEETPVAEDATEVTAPEAEVEVELPDWEAASRDLFQEDPEDEPDFTALADEELSSDDDNFAPGEFDDEQTAALKRDALAAKKRAEHYERLHLKSSRKGWETDVRSQTWGEFLPEDLSTIKATSHRDFLRQAKATAKANYTVLKPHLDKLQAERERLKTVVTQEARQEVQTAWGRPTVGGRRAPDNAAQQQGDVDQKTGEALAEARRSRSMVGAVKAMIDGGIL